MSSSAAAVHAVTQNYDLISNSTLDPLQFALKLLSIGIIAQDTFRLVTDESSGMTKPKRLCILLEALVDAISLKGVALFDSLMEVLKDMGGATCEGLSAQLRLSYNKVLSDGTAYSVEELSIEPLSVHVTARTAVWSSYNSFLKAMYSRRLDAFEQWPPVHTSDYIPVMFSEVSPSDTEDVVRKKSRKILAGDVDGAFSSRQQVNSDDLISKSLLTDGATVILIEGAPGIGKTAFSYTICQKWASGSVLQKFKGVIRWSLSDLMELNPSSVSDLVKHDSRHIEMEIVKALCEESGEGILFIFDGWDEIPQHATKENVTFLLDLIKGKKLPKASHIMTTRSLQMRKSFKLSRSLFDYCFEITGFSDQNILEYIQKAFVHHPDESKVLLRQLETRPDILSMCYIPIHCAIVVYVFRQKQKLPRTLTEFYQVFTLNSLLRNLQLRVEGGDEIDELASLSHLPRSIRDVFVKLSELAFRGLWADKHSYSEDEVQMVVHSTAAKIDQLGVLQAQHIFHSTGISMSFHFLHSSVQHFLAAHFLTTLQYEEQRKYIDKYISYIPFYSVWLFFCGICSYSQLQRAGFLEKTSEHIKDSNEFVSDVLSSTSTLDSDDGGISSESEDELPSQTGITIDTCSILETASFADSRKQSPQHHASSPSSLPNKESMILQGPSTVIGGVSSVQRAEICPYRSDSRTLLFFMKCAYEFKGSAFSSHMISLCKQSLLFHNCNLKRLDMISIGYFLQNSNEKFQLRLTNCKLQADHLAVFCHQILQARKLSVSLKKLFVYHNDLRAAGALELSRLAPILKSCEILDVASNDLCDDGLQYITTMLSHLVQLKALNLASNNIRCVDKLCNAICVHSFFTHLYLSNNPIGSAGASHITEVLRSCQTLCHLGLANTDIGDDGVLVLAEGIDQADNLKSLDLQDNGISETGAAYLATVLVDSHITKLFLNSNNIGTGGAGLIFSALSSSKVFRYLNISDCSIYMNDLLLVSLYNLMTSAPLEKLDISYNPLTDEELASIVNIMADNSCITHYLVMAMGGMGVLTSLALADILTQSLKLTHLTISGTEFLYVQITDSNSFQSLLDSLSQTLLPLAIKFNITDDDMKAELKKYLVSVNEQRKISSVPKLRVRFCHCEEYSEETSEIEDELFCSEDDELWGAVCLPGNSRKSLTY